MIQLISTPIQHTYVARTMSPKILKFVVIKLLNFWNIELLRWSHQTMLGFVPNREKLQLEPVQNFFHTGLV